MVLVNIKVCAQHIKGRVIRQWLFLQQSYFLYVNSHEASHSLHYNCLSFIPSTKIKEFHENNYVNKLYLRKGLIVYQGFNKQQKIMHLIFKNLFHTRKLESIAENFKNPKVDSLKIEINYSI